MSTETETRNVIDEMRATAKVPRMEFVMLNPSDCAEVVALIDHLTAENKAQAERIAGLENELACFADAAAVERAISAIAMHEDGALWPDAYSDDEQINERNKMQIALAAARNTKGAQAYCRACQSVGMSNCQHFDECGGATCVTCHRPLNEFGKLKARIADHENADSDCRRLVRELDLLLNGTGAAEQASLCDLVSQCKRIACEVNAPVLTALTEARARIAELEAMGTWRGVDSAIDGEMVLHAFRNPATNGQPVEYELSTPPWPKTKYGPVPLGWLPIPPFSGVGNG